MSAERGKSVMSHYCWLCNCRWRKDAIKWFP